MRNGCFPPHPDGPLSRLRSGHRARLASLLALRQRSGTDARWHSRSAARSATIQSDRASARATASPTSFSLQSVMLVVTLAALVLGSFSIAPGLGIFLAIVSVPALIRTAIMVRRGESQGMAADAKSKAIMFAASACRRRRRWTFAASHRLRNRLYRPVGLVAFGEHARAWTRLGSLPSRFFSAAVSDSTCFSRVMKSFSHSRIGRIDRS